jgi:DNA-binding response OmpR family regulator
VNQLLDLSKLEAGAIKIEYVSEDIIAFLKANTFAFQSLADIKNISIGFEADTPSLVMKFDRDKLEKICSNLLSNAFKFTPSGGEVKVAVRASTGGDNTRKINILVSDSGPGIPEQDLSMVFNRFYQAGTVSRSSTGSGIGLELTRELVGICGGEISVRNLKDRGAEFSFTLPLLEGEQLVDVPAKVAYQALSVVSEEAMIATALLNGGGNAENNKEVVLVIEDNEEVRDYIVTSLGDHYHVLVAEDGEKGIVKALEVVPDLVITDVMMPFKDGMEVCRTLKDDERTSHIPVIMLTAKADIESKIEGLQSGADDYLPKPFHTKELLVRIANLIQQRRKLQEKFKAGVSVNAEANNDLPQKEKLFLSRLNEYIDLHLTEEEYGVEELSRDMAMSRMQLHRKLKAVTNTSASLYIRSIRLKHARRLLEEGIYNVSEVAYRVGFNSPTYFSTCFSEEYGFAPSELKAGTPTYHQA